MSKHDIEAPPWPALMPPPGRPAAQPACVWRIGTAWSECMLYACSAAACSPPPHSATAAPLNRRHPPLSPPRREIAADYADKQPLVIGTLKGAVVFMSDLVRAMEPTPAGLELDFVRASSYGAGTVSSGKVALTMVGGTDVKGRHVLLVRWGWGAAAGSRRGWGASRPVASAVSAAVPCSHPPMHPCMAPFRRLPPAHHMGSKCL